MSNTQYLVVSYHSIALGEHRKCFQVEGTFQRACLVYRGQRKSIEPGTQVLGMNVLPSRPPGMAIEEVIRG